jgi:outer membrane protein assembly factor BamB
MRAYGGLGVAVVAVVLSGGTLRADIPPHKVYTRPEPPPREVLDRLNLQLRWRTYLPMDGSRDGLANVQMLGRDMLVQTRSGLVALLDAETGVTRWRTRVGLPYRVVGEPAANSRTVLVINNTILYALDRASGAVQWEHRLPGGVTASPVVDEDFIYIPVANGRLYSFLLPRMDLLALQAKGLVASEERPVSKIYEKNRLSTGNIGPLSSVRATSIPEETGAQPVKAWETVTGLLEQPPLITRDSLLAVKPDGTAAGITKLTRDRAGVGDLYRFAADGPITVPAGQYGDMAYLGSQDRNVYALNINTGRVPWRFTAGQPVTREPVPLEKDVYVTAGPNGMTRLDRADGIALWRVPRGDRVLESNPEADRFLAANPKFVYATDRSGRLLVLDRRLGHKLSGYDFRDFTFPVVNDYTDRLYLASNHGLVVCLHDKEYRTPFRHRKLDDESFLSVEEKLARKISDPGSKPAPLADILAGLKARYNLTVVISEPRFQEAMMEPPGARAVAFPKVDNEPLGDVLKKILAEAKATYEIVGEDVVVIPAAKPKMP